MSDRVSWNDFDKLPQHDGRCWAVFQKGRQRDLDLASITELVALRGSAGAFLVGAPGSQRFVPPICVAELSPSVLRIIGNYQRSIITVFAACATVFLLLAMLRPASKILPLGINVAVIAALLAVDYLRNLRQERGVAERAMFSYWIRNNPRARKGLMFWVGFGFLMASLQLLLQQRLGGMDSLFRTYGMMYSSFHAGEFWRLLSGPYFHYSITHFATNFSLLLFVGSLTWALLGPSTVWVFAIANIFAALTQYLLGGHIFDNFGGVSGGMYALYGLLATACMIKRGLLPKGFALLFVGIAILGIVSAEMLSERAATVAHVSGFFIGASMCVFYVKRLRHQTKPVEQS